MIHEKIKLTATKIAESSGTVAEVKITTGYPITFNDIGLTSQMLPTVQEVAGKENVKLVDARTVAEDFSFYAQKVPGLFLFLGGMPKGQNPLEAASHHTPDFYIDESSMKLGVRTLCNLTIDYVK